MFLFFEFFFVLFAILFLNMLKTYIASQKPPQTDDGEIEMD